jgi:hypothetical protein
MLNPPDFLFPTPTLPTNNMVISTATLTPPMTDTASPPTPILEIPKDAMAVVRDSRGTITNITTFITDRNFNAYFSDKGLESIFSHGNGAYIPVSQNDFRVILIPIDQISEIQYSFTVGIFILVNGERIKGAALIEGIGGDSSQGEVYIPMQEIRELKLNPQLVEQYVKTQTADTGYSYYDPQATEFTVDITLTSKASISLQRVALTVRHLGCDPNYINTPCKHYTDWETDDSINIKIGNLSDSLDMSLIESISLKPETMPVELSVKLLDGRIIEATLDQDADSVNYAWDGIVGISNEGFIYFVPYFAIETISFTK